MRSPERELLSAQPSAGMSDDDRQMSVIASKAGVI
jgi:hypothetical protein